jgi:hypothetical protein
LEFLKNKIEKKVQHIHTATLFEITCWMMELLIVGFDADDDDDGQKSTLFC